MKRAGAPIATGLALAAALAAIAAACGGTSPSAQAPAKPIAWDAMNADQKAAFMRTTVLPRMKQVFMDFDPHKYRNMDCVPCHSADRSRGWKMPNPDLLIDESCLRGTATSLYGSESAAVGLQKMNRFMRDRVQPEMAALLGRPSVEPTAAGFNCFGCHTADRPNPVVLPPPSPVE